MTTEKTALALRVLTAYNQRQHPDERDVLLLRAYCPMYPDMSPDEIACLVIQEMIDRQKGTRGNGHLIQEDGTT